jgi:hypothetical protein
LPGAQLAFTGKKIFLFQLKIRGAFEQFKSQPRPLLAKIYQIFVNIFEIYLVRQSLEGKTYAKFLQAYLIFLVIKVPFVYQSH